MEGGTTPATLGEVRQWAASAQASSEFGSDSWAAYQAAGKPDVTECGDNSSAWASSTTSGTEWIELYFSTPVIPTEINIYQTYNPGMITKVELIDDTGLSHEVYTADAKLENQCPATLNIPVEGADYNVQTVIITLDLSTLNDWSEIDAVELVGQGDTSSAAVTSEDPGTQITFDTPEGFLWRIGGTSGMEEGHFISLGGMDTSEDGTLYAADSIHGICAVDADQAMTVFDYENRSVPSDVKVGPDGNLYVADWGINQVVVLSAQGELITNFGETGTGEGQFGTFSPSYLAVAPDGKVYVVDDNEDASGNSIYRIHVFTAQGSFVKSLALPSDFSSPNGLEFGPDGNLYLAGFMNSYILKMDTNGAVKGKIGEDVIGYSSPEHIAIDADGNFYLSVWSPNSVMKLSAQGELLGQWGVEIENGELDWPEGGLYMPSGVAVSPDGQTVYVADWSGGFAYINAFQFP